jgi:hypothetical protein
MASSSRRVTLIFLFLVECLTVVGYYSLLAVLYLRQYSSSHVIRVLSTMEFSPYVELPRMGAVQRACFSE